LTSHLQDSHVLKNEAADALIGLLTSIGSKPDGELGDSGTTDNSQKRAGVREDDVIFSR
jgi:hypothetical protein